MARNDGIDRTSVRNLAVSDKAVGNTQQHNEREKDSYRNPDILPHRTEWNVHFKKPTASYTDLFAQMEAAGTISTRGLKPDATHYCELIFDVNSAYFDNHGGYEFAKQFYADAYKAAVQIVGGEQYILSAVMHADEINRAMTEALGREVYHYHLHVVYVPVVKKQILWSKRCKDKALVGTVKETVMQVSRSKKWASKPLLDESGKPVLQKNGKPVLKKSYSILQDDFFDYMHNAGYTDVERGERGSTEEHLTVTQFKVQREQELLDGTFLVPDTMTVEEMLYKWIPIQSTKHKWSPKTYTQSVAMVQNLIVPYIGNRKVQELRTYDIEKFYATLAKTPCGQYVHGVKQDLSEKQKKRLLSSTSIHEVHTLLKTAFSYAVEWDLIHKIPLPRDAPKVNIEERTIWDEKTMLAALQTIENPALHLAVHMSMILSLREGEILGLQPSDLDFDAADGRGTISVSKTMQRANKDALEKLDPNQVYHTFPDRREGSKSSLILKKPKTKKSNRVLYMTKPLKEELLAWLEKLKQDEQNAPEKYSNCGQLFRLPDGLPIAPELLTKWYRQWRSAHPEFEQIVFHGLRHSSATYQLLQSDGDFKSVQGNTGHATASVLMDTYAHTQDKPRLELTEKIEANFYSQDLTPAAPQPRQNEKPAATKISGKEILEAIRLMDADERRELTRALFA